MRARAVLLVLGSALAAGLVATLVELDAPTLGRAALGRASEASEMSLEASRFRFHLLEGLTIEGVRARSARPGYRFDLELGRLRFEHELRSLIRGRLLIVRVVAESPRLQIRLGTRGANLEPPRDPGLPRSSANRGQPHSLPDASEEKRGEPAIDVELAVSELVIESGALWVLDQTEGERIALDGVELTLREPRFDRNALSLVHGLSASGEIRASEIRFASTRLSDVFGRMESDRGKLRLDDLQFASGARRLSGRLALDGNVLPLSYEISLDTSSIDLPPWARGAKARIEGRGFGLEARNFTGAGALTVAAGALPDVAWVRTLGQASGIVGLVGAPFDSAEVPFEMSRGTVRVRPFELKTSGTSWRVEGTIDLQGPIVLTFTRGGDVFRLEGDPDAPVMSIIDRRP
ncbi:MAG TPA: AsmA-like C-terminal region-containing protein [Vicinamibacteria bacterium]|nr:AsmA-like C-terminal region-containing protein [Vicinamibacteria bacterium]